MKRSIAPIFAACALAVTCVSALAGDDPARALLEESVAASGGMDAIGAWKTLEQTGEMFVHWEGWGAPHAQAVLKVKRPDKLYFDQDFSAYDHPFFFTYYGNGGDAWAVVNLGVRQHPRYTQAVARMLENTGGVHHFLTACDTFFLVADVPDDSLVAGADVDRVGIVDEGDTVMVDLDKSTHLPVRILRDGGAEQTLLADYRDVGAVKFPFKVTTYQDGAVSAEYLWKEIVLDKPIDDALFEENRPAEQASG